MENCKELENKIKEIINKSKNFKEYEIVTKLESYFIPDILMCSKLNKYILNSDTDKFITQFLTMKNLSKLILDLRDFDDHSCSCARFKFISVFAKDQEIADKFFVEFKNSIHYSLGTVRGIHFCYYFISHHTPILILPYYKA